MMIASTPGPAAASVKPPACRPPPIWYAPMPREAAEPNSVATMARMSIALPRPPSAALLPISGTNAWLISCRRPRRNV
jgi:hypothetical protein